MTVVPAVTRRDRIILTLVPLLALTGSILSVAMPDSCNACERAKRFIGPLPLAEIGVAFYASVLLWAIAWRATNWLARAIVLAAGVHLTLFGLLLWRQTPCWICLGTGLCPIAGTVYLWGIGRVKPGTVATFILLGAIGVGGPIAGYIRYNTYQYQSRVMAVVREAVKLIPRAEEGQIQLIYFGRDGCPRCDNFKHNILPQLLKADPSLIVVERPATEEMSTPSVVARGKKSFVATGPHPVEEYQKLIRQARESNR